MVNVVVQSKCDSSDGVRRLASFAGLTGAGFEITTYIGIEDAAQSAAVQQKIETAVVTSVLSQTITAKESFVADGATVTIKGIPQITVIEARVVGSKIRYDAIFFITLFVVVIVVSLFFCLLCTTLSFYCKKSYDNKKPF